MDFEHSRRTGNATGEAPPYTRLLASHIGHSPKLDATRSSYQLKFTEATTQQTIEISCQSGSKIASAASMIHDLEPELSVEDVMGMYERGFEDDVASNNATYKSQNDKVEENEDRPSTSHSKSESVEITRRLTRTLEAFENIYIPLGGDSQENSHTRNLPEFLENNEARQNTVLVARMKNDHFSPLPTLKDAQSVKQPSCEAFPTTTLPMQNSGQPISTKFDSKENYVYSQQLTTCEPSTFCLPLVPGPVTPTDPREESGSRDRYGFLKENKYISRNEYDKWNSRYEDYLARRKKKWQQYLRESGLMTEKPNRFPPPNSKTKRFIRKGIPPEWRGAAWFYYAGGPAILAKHEGLYDEMSKRQAKEIDVEAIEKDLHRTFPENERFKLCRAAQEPVMITSLRRVLQAFSIFNPKIGYCQSLNYIAGMLLLFVETEEQCFWLLNIITRIYLPGTHDISLEGSKVDLGVLMQFLKESMPSVWVKVGGDIDSMGRVSGRFRRGTARQAADPDVNRLPPITLSMTSWFMSCFIGTLPVEPTLRVWDVFFYEGSKTLFRIALTIFKLGENQIRALKDPMEMFELMQSLPRKFIDANALLEGCFKHRNGFGHLSQDTIDSRRQQRRQAARLELAKVRG